MLLPQERIPERTCEQIVDVHVRQVVEQVLEVPEISSQDREVHDTVEQILDVPVPEMVEQLVEVPETVSRDGVQQRTVEQIVDAPVMQAVEELAEVSKVFSQDRIQQRIVEQTIPAISLAETIVVVPVIQMQGTTQRGVNTHAQHVVNAVEVEKPKIIELIVQRKKFIFQEKINQETKPVEFPQAQFLDKAGDMPIVMQQQMFTAQTAQKAMEVPPLQFIDKVGIPVVAQRQIRMNPDVQKTIEISQLQYCDEVIDVPVVSAMQVPRAVKKTAETPQLQVVNVPVVLIAQASQLLSDVQAPTMQVVEKTVEDTQLQIVVEKTTDDPTAAAQHQSTRQQHNNYHSKEAMQQRERKEEKGLGERERGRKDEVGRDQEGGRKEKERKPEVKKDVTGWTVVTRNRRQRKMVQIFVRVNGSKATPMDVNLTDDKVEDVIRRIQNDEDVYVTMHGRVLKRGEKLKSYEVTDGCTIQVMSRLRGGGKHKDKRSKADTKQSMEESRKKDQQVGSMSDKCQEMTKDQKDALIQTIERNEGYRKLITTISEAENWEHEIQCFRKQLQEQSGIEEERAKVMEWGMRWAVEARRRGRGAEQEQRRQEEQRQRRHEEQGQNTGRGSAGLVRGGDERCRTDETSRKGKGKGNGGKGEHDGKAGGVGSKGRQQVENMRATTSAENHEEDLRKLLEMVEREEMELEMMQQEEMEHEEQRSRVAPNMGAGGSHPQATSDPARRRSGRTKERDTKAEMGRL